MRWEKTSSAPCSPLHHPVAHPLVGRFRPFCSSAWLQAGFPLAGRGVFLGAQKLPTSYGDGGAPPSPCTCNEWHPSNDTHPAVPAQACVASRLPCMASRLLCVASRLPCVASRLPADGLLSRTKVLQHTDPEPPLPPRCPGRNAACQAPPEEGEAAASCSVPKL